MLCFAKMNWLRQLVGGRPVTVLATADHVELGDGQVILGLKLGWSNFTGTAIFIEDIQAKVFLERRKGSPHVFTPLERFARLPGQRSFQKKPFSFFMLRPQEMHIEYIRFLNQDISDIAPCVHLLEFEITAADHRMYAARTKLRLESTIKYRQAEEWMND